MAEETRHESPGIAIESLRVDTKAQQEGIWVETPALGEGTAVRVRSTNSVQYRRALARISKRYTRRVLRGGDVDPVQQDRITARAFAEAIVVPDEHGIAWRGLNDASGNPIPYSPEQVFEWLSDPDWKRIADAWAFAAAEVGEDDEEWEQDAGEGFAPRSSGT